MKALPFLSSARMWLPPADSVAICLSSGMRMGVRWMSFFLVSWRAMVAFLVKPITPSLPC